jgi:hypothetical protein
MDIGLCLLLITLLIIFGLGDGFCFGGGLGWDDAAMYWSCLYLMPQYDLY